MFVYQCKSCLKIVSNDLSLIKCDSNYMVVTGVENISLMATSDPHSYYLICHCGYKLGECQERMVNEKQQMIYKLQIKNIICCCIRKLFGHGKSDPKEHESDAINSNQLLDDDDDDSKDIKKLAANIEALEKELSSIKEEKYGEKMETLSTMVGDTMGALMRMAELVCELHSNVNLENVINQIF